MPITSTSFSNSFMVSSPFSLAAPGLPPSATLRTSGKDRESVHSRLKSSHPQLILDTCGSKLVADHAIIGDLANLQHRIPVGHRERERHVLLHDEDRGARTLALSQQNLGQALDHGR